MRIEKSVVISTMSVLPVTVTIPAKSYRNVPTKMSATWSGWGPYEGSILWGDGSSEQFTAPAADVTKYHIYTAIGNYTVTVSVYDQTTGELGSGTASTQIAESLSATLTALPMGGAIPLPVSFTFTMSGGYTPYSWSLDPGDGSAPYSNPTSPRTHTYIKVGSFTAKLTVTDALGALIVAGKSIFAGVVDVKKPLIIVSSLVTGIILTAVGTRK